MSQGAIIAVGALGVMLCCSSSSAVMMMGGDGDKGSGTGGSGGGSGTGGSGGGSGAGPSGGGSGTGGSGGGSGTGPSGGGPTPNPTGLPKGRHVKLVHTVAYCERCSRLRVDDRNKIINLAEVDVFNANGINLATGKTVTGSSEHSTYGYVNLTDGNKTNFAATVGRTRSEYDSMQVDLGAEKEIKKIVITNRTDCCKNRAAGIKAVVLGADGTTVIKETPAITTEADTYTFTFPGTSWS